ncbi:MAG: AraC family transcriptional regulator, partial [Bacteroidaceae bacterium]|nr:AraC family transcriptional regulator [Bacteroidaceae bacterium]
FYLRHDASLTQLAKCLGTNTHYLSQYFARQGLTYNTYINGLRIEHFKGLYQESASTTHTVSASDIAIRCGFSSYRTFSRAFKQDTGQSVTEWVDKTNREREFKNCGRFR